MSPGTPLRTLPLACSSPSTRFSRCSVKDLRESLRRLRPRARVTLHACHWTRYTHHFHNLALDCVDSPLDLSSLSAPASYRTVTVWPSRRGDGRMMLEIGEGGRTPKVRQRYLVTGWWNEETSPFCSIRGPWSHFWGTPKRYKLRC